MKGLLVTVENIKYKISKFRRVLYKLPVFSRMKIKRPALNGLDMKLKKFMNHRGGFFIEAGANDGFRQSNTYYFEKYKGWQGILVEGIPELYEKCSRTRKKSRIFNCALVSNNFPYSHVTMHYANLMSIVEGARGDAENDHNFIHQGLSVQKIQETYSVQVPARTLTAILDECKIQKDIDLFSLDVEGYELEVLKGIDFERYRPKYLCIEAWSRKEIEEFLSPYYVIVENLTERDVLFRSKE